MAAPEIRAVGTVAAGEGTIAPGLPAGNEAGDLLLYPIESRGTEPDTVPTASGWLNAPFGSVVSDTGTTVGDTRLTLLYKIAVGSDATTSSDSGNHQLGRIIGIKKGTFNSTNPFDSFNYGKQAATKSVSIPGFHTDQAEELILAFATGALPDATGTAEFSSAANASLESVTEQIDNTTNAGDGGALFCASGIKKAAGLISATTVTATTSAERAVMAISIRPSSGSAGEKQQTLGHSYTVAEGVTEAQTAAALVAASLGVVNDNKGVSGAIVTAWDGSEAPGGWATAQNKLVRSNGSPYNAVPKYGWLQYGLNDIAFIDSTFSANAKALVKTSLRTALSRMCAAKVFDDSDASVAYSGFTQEPSSDLAGTGPTNHLATANAKTVTITVPSDFPGGTVAIYCGGFSGFGAIFACKVDGSSSETLDTRTAETIKPDNEVSPLMFCKRFTGLAAGAHTIVLTTESIATVAIFDSWAIEATTPPITFLLGQFKLPTKGYETYASIGALHTPTDADIEALELLTKEVAEEFPSQVKFISLASMDKTTNIQSEGIHPNVAGHEEIKALVLASVASSTPHLVMML